MSKVLSDIPVGKIVIEIFENKEPRIQYLGNLDSINFPQLNFSLRNGFFGDYSLRRRDEEMKNIEARKKVQEEEKRLIVQREKEKAEATAALKIENAKKLIAEKEALEKKTLEENQRTEAERILKKDAGRKAKKLAEELAWAEGIEKASKNNEVKGATDGEFKL